MTITIDSETEARLRTLSEQRHQSIESCLAEIVARESEVGAVVSSDPPMANLVKKGKYLVFDTTWPDGWDPVRAVDEVRLESLRKAQGL